MRPREPTDAANTKPKEDQNPSKKAPSHKCSNTNAEESTACLGGVDESDPIGHAASPVTPPPVDPTAAILRPVSLHDTTVANDESSADDEVSQSSTKVRTP
ncbi:hypothetical protein PInf_017345 [Phytophthora infestans]|nr:hypothetical protein PInf_017345 [Phytophthora infestans]